jgi:hypothetical protein
VIILQPENFFTDPPPHKRNAEEYLSVLNRADELAVKDWHNSRELETWRGRYTALLLGLSEPKITWVINLSRDDRIKVIRKMNENGLLDQSNICAFE